MKHMTADTCDERGQSISLFVLLIMGALIMTTGLVIDGGQKVAATSRAESAAAGASRAAGNAAASAGLYSGPRTTPRSISRVNVNLSGRPLSGCGAVTGLGNERSSDAQSARSVG